MRRLPLDFALLSKCTGELAGASVVVTHIRPDQSTVVDRGLSVQSWLPDLATTKSDVVVRR
jgi:hypothetical protein